MHARISEAAWLAAFAVGFAFLFVVLLMGLFF